MRPADEAAGTYDVEYSYLSNRHLIEQLKYKSGVSTTLATANYSYHGDGDVPTEINNVWASDPDDPNEIVSKYTYAYDNLWRTKWVVRQGDATYGAFANDHHDAFSYSDRNELTQSKRYNSTSPPSTSNPDTGDEPWFVLSGGARLGMLISWQRGC